jgi:hypothetical protein
VPTDWTAYGGGAGETVLGTGVLIAMLIAIVLTFLLPRKFVVVPILFGLFLIPVGQTFVLGGVHLYVSRLMLLAGLLRLVASRRSDTTLPGSGYTSIDKVFTLWAVYRASAFILVYEDAGSVLNQVGSMWDALGGYFLMRLLIRDDEDVQRAIKCLCGVAALLGVTMLYEKIGAVNVYGILTGHPIIPEMREGSIRAQGPFHHAILAGTFGATLLPLMVWLSMQRKSKFSGLFGIGASTIITFAAASSTPVSAYMAAVLGIILWPIRSSMRLVRWGIVIGVLILNFAMNAPVWWLLAHIDLAGGSAGHHRAELVDNFVRHFGDWWLIGTKDYGQWGFLMMDISNQYVAEGEIGGLVSFICIITVITLSFKKLGIARNAVRGDRKREWYFWLLGVALFAHTVAFLGISYFDQTRFAWYALLAMISAATWAETTRSSDKIETDDVNSYFAAPPAEAIGTGYRAER